MVENIKLSDKRSKLNSFKNHSKMFLMDVKSNYKLFNQLHSLDIRFHRISYLKQEYVALNRKSVLYLIPRTGIKPPIIILTVCNQ